MKSFREISFRIYDRIFPLIKDIRGATRVHRFLLENWLEEKINEENGVYKTEYDSIEIYAKSFQDLEDVYREDLITSYLQGFELEKDSDVLVAGAYPGAFVNYLAKKIENGKVIAIEPDDSNKERLEDNVELNDVENVDIVEKPIYSSETTVNFSNSGDHSSRIVEKGVEKKTTTVDKLREEYGEFDLVTMDIEGAEVEAVKGAEQTIKQHSTRFAIRSYHQIDREHSSVKIEDIAEDLGRKPSTLDYYPIERTTYF